MTTPSPVTPLLFGAPYALKPSDYASKSRRLAALLENSGKNHLLPPALAGESENLLLGCIEAMRLVQREGENAPGVVRAVHQRLQEILLDSGNSEHAIGLVAGSLFFNISAPANDDRQAYDSMLTCLGTACTVCLTLEQEFARVAAQYRDATLSQATPSPERAHAQTVVTGHAQGPVALDDDQQAVAALSSVNLKGRQRTT